VLSAYYAGESTTNGMVKFEVSIKKIIKNTGEKYPRESKKVK
jgi:hypothetical protein